MIAKPTLSYLSESVRPFNRPRLARLWTASFGARRAGAEKGSGRIFVIAQAHFPLGGVRRNYTCPLPAVMRSPSLDVQPP